MVITISSTGFNSINQFNMNMKGFGLIQHHIMLVWTFYISMERSPWKHFSLILKLDYVSFKCFEIIQVRSKYQISTLSFSCIDWLWSSDAISWHKFGSTLAQVMAWCLRASSHYLYQYWLTIKGVLWYSYESSFTRGAHELNPQHVFKDYISFKSLLHTTGTNDLTHWGQMIHICLSDLTINGSDNGL